MCLCKMTKVTDLQCQENELYLWAFFRTSLRDCSTAPYELSAVDL